MIKWFPVLLLTACSYSTVPIGKDSYMLSGSGPGPVGGYRTGQVVKQAAKHCARMGLQILVERYTSDSVFYKCLEEGDPALETDWRRGPDIIIQDQRE